jgi:radical SAM superfamily enzyme YgiQ (UPF0313 family)
MKSQAKRGLTLEGLKKFRMKAKEIGLKVHFLLSIGFPQETKKSIVETYELIQKLEPESLGITVITPYPGTPLYVEAVRNGWIESYNWEEYGGHHVVMHTDNLSKDDITTALVLLNKGYNLLSMQREEKSENMARLKEAIYRDLLIWACDLDLLQQRLSAKKSIPYKIHIIMRRYLRSALSWIYCHLRKWIPSTIRKRLWLLKIYMGNKAAFLMKKLKQTWEEGDSLIRGRIKLW